MLTWLTRAAIASFNSSSVITTSSVSSEEEEGTEEVKKTFIIITIIIIKRSYIVQNLPKKAPKALRTYIKLVTS